MPLDAFLFQNMIAENPTPRQFSRAMKYYLSRIMGLSLSYLGKLSANKRFDSE
jgi:hypothetical protein